MGLLLNFALTPKKISHKKTIISNFGIGIKFSSSTVEEVLQKMMTKEENIDDYDYEKLVKGGAKI